MNNQKSKLIVLARIENWWYNYEMTNIFKAPVEYIPDFIPDPATVFDTLWRDLAWLHVASVRREYWSNDLGADYTYGRGVGERTYAAQPWHYMAKGTRDYLEQMTGVFYNACFINGYDGPRQSLGRHADDSPNIDHTKPIAVVSVGEARFIQFRPMAEHGPEDVEKCLLEPGSLLIMKPGMQQTHLHDIPKSDRACGPRVSMTFRCLLT